MFRRRQWGTVAPHSSKSPENALFYWIALEFVLKSELQLGSEDLSTKALHVSQWHTDTCAANTTLSCRPGLPYAFSQSRDRLSSSSNVNIATCVWELSNTLTHNLFQLTLTHSESVIIRISKMPDVPGRLLHFFQSSSIVLFWLCCSSECSVFYMRSLLPNFIFCD